MDYFCICLDTSSKISFSDAIDRCNHCRPYMDAAREELRERKRDENSRAIEVARSAFRL